jgi:hypothetical protein
MKGGDMDDRAKIFNIRGRLLTGALTYDEAKAEVSPIIEAMNKRARDIARKHGKRFIGFTFSGLMR